MGLMFNVSWFNQNSIDNNAILLAGGSADLFLRFSR